MATFDTVDGTVCNAEQYSQSQAFGDGNSIGPSISCLTRGESIGLTVSILYQSSFRSSNSSSLQLAAEASLISSISVIIIFIRIGVRSISFLVSLLFDDMLHSGMYGGIGGRFQTVTGTCFGCLLTSTWFA